MGEQDSRGNKRELGVVGLFVVNEEAPGKEGQKKHRNEKKIQMGVRESTSPYTGPVEKKGGKEEGGQDDLTGNRDLAVVFRAPFSRLIGQHMLETQEKIRDDVPTKQFTDP